MVEINTEVIVGPAGTGKSTLLRQRIENKEPMVLTATTGVAAVNLGQGVTTINSLLRFYKIDSLITAYKQGWLKRSFVNLARKGVKNVVIDECSMLTSDHLQVIYQGAVQAAQEVHERRENGDPAFDSGPVGLILTGDFCQLPPVSLNDSPKFAFMAACWPKFAAKTTKLTTIYRQSSEMFKKALQAAREGKGVDCTLTLQKCGVKYTPDVDYSFDGLTIYPVNAQVDKHNRIRLGQIEAPDVEFTSRRWGKPATEWYDIPEAFTLKDGAQVMVLANKPRTFEYVNGDIAVIQSVPDNKGLEGDEEENPFNNDVERLASAPKAAPLGDDRALPLALRRTGRREFLNKVIRTHVQVDAPYEGDFVDFDGPLPVPTRKEERDKWFARYYYPYLEKVVMKGVPYLDPMTGLWVVGEVEYMPVRLGWASTVHKAQGLTLEKVQIDCRNLMAGKPGLMYVALSRCREPENITIVGNPSILAKRICTAPEVREWI